MLISGVFQGSLMILFLASAFAASPSVTLAMEGQIAATGFQPRVKMMAMAPRTEHWGVSAFAMVTPTYAEAYVGPSWSPMASASFTASVGIETADAPWRVAASAFVTNRRLWTFATLEYGGSGLWYKVVASYSFGPIDVGAFTARFDGLGPRVGVSDKGFEFWGAPLYDFESQTPKGLLGFTWSP